MITDIKALYPYSYVILKIAGLHLPGAKSETLNEPVMVSRSKVAPLSMVQMKAAGIEPAAVSALGLHLHTALGFMTFPKRVTVHAAPS
jgi:hypothetical protein